MGTPEGASKEELEMSTLDYGNERKSEVEADAEKKIPDDTEMLSVSIHPTVGRNASS